MGEGGFRFSAITAGWVNLTRDVVYLPSLKYFGPQSNLRATFEMAPHPSREWDTLRQRSSPSWPGSRSPKQARARAFSLDIQIPYCFLYLAGYVRKGESPRKLPSLTHFRCQEANASNEVEY
jgi:hypothetical protein